MSDEKSKIAEAIDAFGQEIADEAEKFFDAHQYERVDELILTGGGTMIPSIRKSLANRLSHYGVRKLHAFNQGKDPQYTTIPIHQMSGALVRGATALGGASVYFDYADNQVSESIEL